MFQLVVAFPKLSVADKEWIDAFRAEHDTPYVSVIEPHYTLVFPTDKALSRQELRAHVELQASQEFETVCRCAQVVDNPFIKKWHVFLVPDQGYSEIVKLHDRLYTGPLEDQLLLDVPFVPHIGIATLETSRECKSLADALNARGLDIRAPVDALEICAYDGVKVATSATVPLRRNITTTRTGLTPVE